MMQAFLLSFSLAMVSLQGPSPTVAPAFGFPVECTVGQTCLIQKLVDHDPGPGRRDYRCGLLTTDGHDGIDIRLRTMAEMRAGVPVVAAAAGTVLRTRDGEPDVSVGERGGRAGKDAGNAVVIDHGDGWQTQYSHLRQGSIGVRPGQRLGAGERIGLIGLSGNTEFPHLHFTVRHHDAAIDPFVGTGSLVPCGVAAPATGLWTPTAARSLGYAPAAVIAAGLASIAPPKPVTDRDPPPALAGPRAPMILWVDAMGARAGDQQRFSIVGPDGRVVHDQQSEIADGGLSWFAYSGKRAPATGWPRGRYLGRYALRRGGAIVAKIDVHGIIK
ncbi:M23 family metallopeptidase [Sphingopyxis sp. L1A2A]|uniref:M23 family metallopeptidase n=1 Tax=Sphingopyxis sp. L1A2A TaxID=2502247 RepID=UPI0010F71CA7|nr:M23 family metallopeptidase [Sphingopyxis sp. L1A2A]